MGAEWQPYRWAASRARHRAGDGTGVQRGLVAEIGIKAAIGKLTVPDDLHSHIVQTGILGLAPDHGLAVADLPMHHHDPFDRLLITQARRERLAVVTADERFAAYDVDLVDASA